MKNSEQLDYMPVENILPSQEEALNKIIIDSIRDLQPPRYWNKDAILDYTREYGIRIMNACYEHEWIVQVPLRPDNPEDYTLIEEPDHSLTFIWSPAVNILGMRKHSQNEAYDFEKHVYELRKKEGTVDANGDRLS